MYSRWKWLTAVVSAVIIFTSFTAARAVHQSVPLKNASGNPVTANEPYSPKQTCGACHNYGSGPVTVSKIQGYANSTGKVAFQTYDVTAYSHGVSVGKHSNQGRGEEWTAALRSVWGAPAFTSSTGMWGRY